MSATYLATVVAEATYEEVEFYEVSNVPGSEPELVATGNSNTAEILHRISAYLADDEHVIITLNADIRVEAGSHKRFIRIVVQR